MCSRPKRQARFDAARYAAFALLLFANFRLVKPAESGVCSKDTHGRAAADVRVANSYNSFDYSLYPSSLSMYRRIEVACFSNFFRNLPITQLRKDSHFRVPPIFRFGYTKSWQIRNVKGRVINCSSGSVGDKGINLHKGDACIRAHKISGPDRIVANSWRFWYASGSPRIIGKRSIKVLNKHTRYAIYIFHLSLEGKNFLRILRRQCCYLRNDQAPCS